MASLLTQLQLINDTDANFRAWGKAISDQMIAGGWIRTTDTGQIDWTTVTKPTGLVDIRGYEIFRSNDGVGSLAELYTRFEYGSGGAAAIQPYMNVQVGWGSDGAGRLTSGGQFGGCNMSTTGASGLVNCVLSAGAGWFVFALGSVTQKTMFFSVERTVNKFYAFENQVLTIAHASGNIYTQLLALNQQRGFPQLTGSYPQTIPIHSSFPGYDGIVSLGMYVGWRGYLTNPAINAYGYISPAFGVDYGRSIHVEAYGEDHTYIVLPNIANFRFNEVVGQQQIVRFE